MKFYRIILSLIAIFALGICFLCFERKEDVIPFKLKCTESDTEIKGWFNSEEKVTYFFVPSYMEMEKVTIGDLPETIVRIEEKVVFCDSSISDYCEEKIQYKLQVGKGVFQKNMWFCVVKSDNVATIHINTASGNNKELLSDKSHKEPVNLVLVDEYGKKDYIGSDFAISGRGNTTWGKAKKPFTLTSTNEISFLGMQGVTKWVLLANAYDDSNIKNKIVYDTASMLGMECEIQSEYVDLYLNEEYMGLYLLCQSPDCISELLNDKSVRTSLFSIEPYGRKKNDWISLEDEHAAIKVHNIGYDIEIVEYIKNIDVMINTTTVRDWEKYLDLESWCKKYLIDEIFENHDAGYASSYYYIVNANDTLVCKAGPIWDYDLSMGYDLNGKNIFSQNPLILYANHQMRSDGNTVLWYGQMLNDESYLELVKNTYTEELSDWLEYLTEEYIPFLRKRIENADKCNRIRWKKRSTLDSAVCDVEQFINKRKRFLDDIWINNVEYTDIICKGLSEEGLVYHYYIRKGTSLAESDFLEYFGVEQVIGWVNESTGQYYDLNSKVDQDTLILTVYK